MERHVVAHGKNEEVAPTIYLQRAEPGKDGGARPQQVRAVMELSTAAKIFNTTQPGYSLCLDLLSLG